MNAANLESLGRHGDIRRALVVADLVDGTVSLPRQLFYSTQISVCLWFLPKSNAPRVIKTPDGARADSFRERRPETLFVDARKLGELGNIESYVERLS
jgi:type I restriction enzyme M protein